MELIPLWEADPDEAYKLSSAFNANENGFENPAFGLSFEQFRAHISLRERNFRGLDLKEGYVSDTVYILESDGLYVGVFKLRHRLNDFLREGPGHIGYGIAPAYRGRGYATNGLALAIATAKAVIPEDEIYLSVFKSNPASLRVQMKNGAYIHHESDTEYFTRIKIR